MKRRFNVDIATIRRDLERTARRLGYDRVWLLGSKTGPGAQVRLCRESNTRTVTCAKFGNRDDNLRAIGLTLEYQRRIRDDYGAEVLRTAAAAAEALPTSHRLTSAAAPSVRARY